MNQKWFHTNFDKQLPMCKLYIKKCYICWIMAKGKECWLIIMKTIWNWCHLSEVNVFLQEATYSPWGHTTISMISIRKIVSTIQYFLPPILSITNIASIWSFNTSLEEFWYSKIPDSQWSEKYSYDKIEYVFPFKLVKPFNKYKMYRVWIVVSYLTFFSFMNIYLHEEMQTFFWCHLPQIVNILLRENSFWCFLATTTQQ